MLAQYILNPHIMQLG